MFKAGLVRNLISDMKAEEEIQFYSFCLQFDAIKRKEKIIRENAFEQKKKKPALTFNSIIMIMIMIMIMIIIIIIIIIIY